jgi:phosphoribosyl-ATP pyrophosphohydrolase
MGEALHSIMQEPDNVEIIVHVDETLGEERRNVLVTALEDQNGIRSAEFCPLRYHLMLVQYNRELMTSQDVLGKVTSQNVHAKLIGPV